MKAPVLAAAVAGMTLCLASGARAHDIPNDVTVQAFVKPEGGRLRLLVRAPLKAMRDVEYPMRGPDRLDISRADGVLHDAATIWIVDNLELYEGDTRLGAPRLATVRALGDRRDDGAVAREGLRSIRRAGSHSLERTIASMSRQL